LLLLTRRSPKTIFTLPATRLRAPDRQADIGIGANPGLPMDAHLTCMLPHATTHALESGLRDLTMEDEMSLHSAVTEGINEINRTSGTRAFRPDQSRLLLDLGGLSSNASGIIAIPSKRPGGYDALTFSPLSSFSDSIAEIGTDLWECAKEHYGLTGSMMLAGAGGMPVKKAFFGQRVILGSSQYTNIISNLGVKFFPRLLLPQGTAAARIAKKTLGTVRVFGVIGRVSGYGAVALGVIDAVVIGKCAYDARHAH
jgi:hypothetical protein